MFDYRIAYGCWLNDSREKPIVDEDWPSIRIDADTLSSLENTMAFLKMAGYNYLDVFGLITNHSWEDDIASTVSAERREKVRAVIDIVHRHGLKVIYGLGVYSWGFDGIIARNAEVRGTSAQAMCASSPAADKIMRRVVDFVCETFAIDGFHLEAADQGRCECEKCRAFESDIDYYNSINARVARYIRERWPGKTLLVNTSGYLSWGDRFSERQLAKIAELAREIDVFIDVGSHGPFVDERDRAAFLKTFPAAFGESNGFWIYPPQRWDRLRWFIPHHNQNFQTLKRLWNDGGRACELYLSPLNNPGAELTTLCNGLFLNDPTSDVRQNLRRAVDMLYAPESDAQRERIAAIFDGAEAAFFAAWHPQRDRKLPQELSDGVEHAFVWSREHPEKAVPGEFFLERLYGLGPGFPCYLTLHFDAEGRAKYRKRMRDVLALAREAVAAQPCERLRRVQTCLENVLADIDLADQQAGALS